MKRKILKNIEWGILICTILLVAIGLVALTSTLDRVFYDELKKTNNVAIYKLASNDSSYFY